ncbi:transketolase [Actinomycetaceae bacterium L2_0104]
MADNRNPSLVAFDQRATLASQRAATRARLNVLRMMSATPAGHVGGALSCIDALAVLYTNVLNIDPANPKDPQRDRFLLSAGHKALAQYAILAEAGFFPSEVLDEYGRPGTRLGGHPDMHKLPGIEGNTGALGHGLPLSVGMSLGLRSSGSDAQVFVLLGDGELPEGSNWEGAAIAAHYNLTKLTALVDVNGLQISGQTCDVMSMEPIADKFEAFGWNVHHADGHDHRELHRLLLATDAENGPSVVVLHTTKAKGIPDIEGQVPSHYWKPGAEEIDKARRELRHRLHEINEELDSFNPEAH